MVTEGNHTYCGEHSVMYVTVESLCCTPEKHYNIVYQLYFKENFNSKKFNDLMLGNYSPLTSQIKAIF